MQTEAKEYWKLFKPAACSTALQGQTKEGVFEELTKNFIKAKVLPSEMEAKARRALEEREAMASTGVGQTVAIPHVKLAGLDEALFSLSIHPAGIEWTSLDGVDVQILFTVIRPERESALYNPKRHLDVMRWISNMSRDADFRRFALGVATKKGLVDLLKEMSGS